MPIEPAYHDYLRDESRRWGHAASIAFPENEEGLLEAMAVGGRLTVQGARTGLAGEAVPGGGRIVNLSRMRRILQDCVVDGKRIVTCEAGCSMEVLQDERWFFPPAPTELTATLGGAIHCGAQGLYAARYGGMEAFVSGVRKLPGTSLIVSAEAVLLPVPDAVWGVGLFFNGEASAMAFLFDPLPEVVAAAEYLDHGALRCIAENRSLAARLAGLPELPSEFTAMAYIELHATSEALAQKAAEVLLLQAERHGADAAFSWALVGWNETRILRDFRHFTQEAVLMSLDAERSHSPDLHVVGAERVLDANALAALSVARQELGIRSACFGHICGGRTRLDFLPTDEKEMRCAKAFLRRYMP